MNNEELSRIIEELESTNSEEEAYFALIENHDERYARANKAGVELIAAQFLKATLEFDEAIKPENNRQIPIEFSKNWTAGNVFIEYIEPVTLQEEIATVNKPYIIQRLLLPIGCFGIAIILVGIFIAGIATVIGWFI